MIIQRRLYTAAVLTMVGMSCIVVIIRTQDIEYFDREILSRLRYLQPDSDEPATEISPPCDENDLQNTEDIMAKLRAKDILSVDFVENLPIEKYQEASCLPLFYEIVAKPIQGVCRSMKRIGGVWIGSLQALDGDKFVCMDKIRTAETCIIYSFGINNEWSFEDIMDTMNCKIYAYDHTINTSPNRGKGISWFKKGMGSSKAGALDTLENHIRFNKHENSTIDYLKVDIEGEELNSLPQWLESGVLENVDQLGMEFHLKGLHNPPRFKWLLQILKDLYKLKFRIISFEPNMTVGKSVGGYYAYFEIVFMKDNVWNYLEDKEQEEKENTEEKEETVETGEKEEKEKTEENEETEEKEEIGEKEETEEKEVTEEKEELKFEKVPLSPLKRLKLHIDKDIKHTNKLYNS